MRRCDICHTIIPPGSDHCPNCGYIYREDLVPSGEKDAKKIENYMKQFQPHPYDTTNETKKVQPQMPDIKKMADSLNMMGGKMIVKSVTILIAFLIIIGIVGSVIGNIVSSVDFVSNNEAVVNFDNYDELNDNFPQIALEVYPFYQQTIEEAMMADESASLYESYTIIGDEISYIQLEANYELSDSISMSHLMYTFGYGWHNQASINDDDTFNSEFHNRTINDEDIMEMARLVNCDQQQVIDAYHQLLDTYQNQIGMTIEEVYDVIETEEFSLMIDIYNNDLTFDLVNNQ